MLSLISLARLTGTAIVLVPLAVTTTIGFFFGRDVFGGGSALYGVMWACFSAVSAVAMFTLFSADTVGRRVASAIVLSLCLACSIAGGWMSLGARHDEIGRADERRRALEAGITETRAAIAAIPRHRPADIVRAEQAARAGAYERDRKAHEATKGNRTVAWQPSHADVARDLALLEELAIGQRAAALQARLAALSETSSEDSGPRATAIVDWLAKQLGARQEAIGNLVMLVFVVAADVIAALGPYCVLGSIAHGAPVRQEKLPLPEPASEPALVVVEQPAAPAPVLAPAAELVQESEADPVAAFLGEAIEPDSETVTAYADIEVAWMAWCRQRGIDGSTVNLGFALSRCGYRSVAMSGRRKGRKGLRIAARLAA